jgi:hypothetical protein
MIAAARRLFREHGYLGTALSDVVTESAAPRGSIYFHFGGKEELAGRSSSCTPPTTSPTSTARQPPLPPQANSSRPSWAASATS